jgi:hypothetical protein
VRLSRAIRAPAPFIEPITSFQMSWLKELKTALINIMRSYIKSSKLIDNVFKKTNHISIALELQLTYNSLDLGLATNIIARKQIKSKIN